MLAVIRPEDVVPHEMGYRAEGNGNVVDSRIGEMEFLGSFWRCRLDGDAVGGTGLIADMSVNAVRRLSLSEGDPLTVEFPPERLLGFAERLGDDNDR